MSPHIEDRVPQQKKTSPCLLWGNRYSCNHAAVADLTRIFEWKLGPASMPEAVGQRLLEGTLAQECFTRANGSGTTPP
eukprot:4874753-Amphidinium_carterae.1